MADVLSSVINLTIRVIVEINQISEETKQYQESCHAMSQLLDKVQALLINSRDYASALNIVTFQQIYSLVEEIRSFMGKFRGQESSFMSKLYRKALQLKDRKENAAKFIDFDAKVNKFIRELAQISFTHTSVLNQQLTLLQEQLQNLAVGGHGIHQAIQNDCKSETIENMAVIESNVDAGLGLPDYIASIAGDHQEMMLYLQRNDLSASTCISSRARNDDQQFQQVLHNKICNIVMKSSRIPLISTSIPERRSEEFLERIGDILGRGEFGKVYKMKHKESGRLFAVKYISIIDAEHKRVSYDDIVKEAGIMSRLQHNNIVRLYDHYQGDVNPDNYLMVMEYVDGRTLETYMRLSGPSIDVDCLKQWMKQAVNALVYLHAQRILHRDLKPENIIVALNSITGTYTIKVFDFGLSRVLSDETQAATSLVGTYTYNSYEKYNRLPYDGRDDIWAIGCIFLELLLQQRLNDKRPGVLLFDKRENVFLDILLQDCDKSDPMMSMWTKHCLCRDYAIRPSAVKLYVEMELSYDDLMKLDQAEYIDRENRSPLPASPGMPSILVVTSSLLPKSSSSKALSTSEITPLKFLTIKEVKTLLTNREYSTKLISMFGEYEINGRALSAIVNGRKTFDDYDVDMSLLSMKKAKIDDFLEEMLDYDKDGVSQSLLVDRSYATSTILPPSSQSLTLSSSFMSSSLLPSSVAAVAIASSPQPSSPLISPQSSCIALSLISSASASFPSSSSSTTSSPSSSPSSSVAAEAEAEAEGEAIVTSPSTPLRSPPQLHKDKKRISFKQYELSCEKTSSSLPQEQPFPHAHKDQTRFALYHSIFEKILCGDIAALLSLKYAEVDNVIEAKAYMMRIYYQGLGVVADKVRALLLAKEVVPWLFNLSDDMITDEDKAFIFYMKGFIYDEELAFTKNLPVAIQYYTLATDHGYTEGHYNLETSNEFDKNFTEDVKYDTSLAEQGDADAQYRLALCYVNGLGVDMNQPKAIRYYTLAADQGHAAAQYHLGCCYRNGYGVETDIEEALIYFTLAADQGNVEAQYNLAMCYENGTGVDKSLHQAVQYYTLAAHQGDAEAQYNLARCYMNGEGVDVNLSEAIRYYTLAADQGDVDAQNVLAGCYMNSVGVEKNLSEALKYFRLAADQGDDDSQYKLGLCYKHGVGVDVNLPEAIRYLKLAANQENVISQYSLAMIYMNGIGVDKDISEAIKYYTIAAKQGHEGAQCNLALCHQYGVGVDENIIEAIRLYTLSSDQGNDISQYSLAVLYKNGIMVSQNLSEAVRYFTLAADQGHVQAQYNIAICLYQGEGVEKNLPEAIRYFKLASDQGHDNAQYNLAVCYKTGRGVAVNLLEAMRLYTLAADQGHVQAQYNIAICRYQGEGVEKNLPEAIRYFTFASDQGHDNAQYNLAVCYQKGYGVAVNLLEAMRLYTLAADQGHVIAQWNLAFLFEYGKVGNTLSEAIKYYKLSADQGYADAQCSLARCYEDGVGVVKDLSVAARYLTLAADQGHANSQYNLGVYFMNGVGVAKNLLEGIRYYTLAADQGYAKAQNNLAYCYANGLGVDSNISEAIRYCTLAANQGDAAAQYTLAQLKQ